MGFVDQNKNTSNKLTSSLSSIRWTRHHEGPNIVIIRIKDIIPGEWYVSFLSIIIIQSIVKNGANILLFKFKIVFITIGRHIVMRI